jgi:hypothetical protein
MDALYFDRTGRRLIIVQAKFKRTGTAPSQEEVLKTINGIRALLDRRFDTFNPSIQNRLDEIEEALTTPGVKIEVVLTYLGEILGQHVTDDLNALQSDMNRLSERMSWKSVGLSQLYNWLVAEQAPAAVSLDVTLEDWAAITTPRKAIYGRISAKSVADLVKAHGRSLFQRNIRLYLGTIGVNIAIEQTVRRHPAELFYLNNGLTAVAEKITQAAGTPRPCCAWRARPSARCRKATGAAMAIRCWLREEFASRPKTGTRN